MSVEKNLGTLFYSQIKIKFYNKEFYYHENLRNQNQREKNKKEVLP